MGLAFQQDVGSGPLKALILPQRSINNASEQMIAAICPFTCVSTIPYKLRGIQELEGFWGVEEKEVNRKHIITAARCVMFYLLCDLSLLYTRQQLKGEFSLELRFSSWVATEFHLDWKPGAPVFAKGKSCISLSLVLLISRTP